jgi:teichuronic acid biosynthesis glycosyltransferase TuaC
MGSDVLGNSFTKNLIRIFNKRRWSALIVKSEEMKKIIGIAAAQVIPNGVDVEKFRPMPKEAAKARVGFNEKKHLIFVGDPQRPEKNFQLARAALELLGDDGIELHVLSRKPHDALPDFMNAADALLLTSVYEGSPNVVKEAMACNCPIVATAVGDVKLIVGDTRGCFLASMATEDVAEKVKEALAFGARTNGRERLLGLALDQGSIARRIIGAYAGALKA